MPENNEGNKLCSARKNENTWHSFTFSDKDTKKNWPKISRHTYLLHFWPPEDLLKSHQQGAQRHLQCLRLPSSVAGQGYSEEKRMILILLHS